MAEIRPPIGEQLRQARESRNLSIEKISQETHIRLGYLQAIEAGDLEVLPSPTQARGFMRAYARYLDLNFDEMLTAVSQSTPAAEIAPNGESEPAAAEVPQDSDSPDKIYSEIGRSLAEQRNLLGFSIEDVERQTHLKAHYLRALENGRMYDLPSPVQGRGMLSNYATFLGLDTDALLLRFADGLQAGLATRRSQNPTRPRQPENVATSTFRRLISGDMLFGGLLIILLSIFFIWGVGRISNLSSQETTTPTEISLGGLLLNSPTAEATSTVESPDSPGPTSGAPSGETTLTPDAAALPVLEGAVQVYVIVHQRAWMRVLADGEEVFVGRVVPGAALPFSGEETVEILTGNGLALEVVYNQTNIGRLGFFGEVVHRVFMAEGIFTPTPTNTFTPTPSPRTTETPAFETPALETPTPDGTAIAE
ncbi:MAG TPA: RodZ domain-containing protein [Anaerolineales bacterium]|nr:RodZ domain-containing protein [Anaerolineales bacterium]